VKTGYSLTIVLKVKRDDVVNRNVLQTGRARLMNDWVGSEIRADEEDCPFESVGITRCRQNQDEGVVMKAWHEVSDRKIPTNLEKTNL